MFLSGPYSQARDQNILIVRSTSMFVQIRSACKSRGHFPGKKPLWLLENRVF